MGQTIGKPLRERLKDFRKSKKLSVPKFSLEYGFSQDNVYKWEKGTKPSDAQELIRLESILENVPILNKRHKDAKHLNKAHDSSQALNTIVDSNNMLAKSNHIMAISNQKLVESQTQLVDSQRKLVDNNTLLAQAVISTVGAHKEISEVDDAKFSDLLEVIAGVGSGNLKWSSIEEAAAELSKRFYGKKVIAT